MQRSQHEVMALQAENRALEAQKRELMMRRKRLFNEFTMGLKDSGVPLEVKKRKLMELRSIVKKKNPPPPPPQPSTKSKVRAVSAKSEKVLSQPVATAFAERTLKKLDLLAILSGITRTPRRENLNRSTQIKKIDL